MTSKETKKEKPEDMTFKNKAVETINKLVHENAKLKDKMSKDKKGRRVSAATKIQGLQTLTNKLGTK